jgi:RND family efflux transporter MFP subunit
MQSSAEAPYIASGPIVVENQVDVSAQREGVVAKILVDTGTAVRKGQTLALLDDRQLAADREAANAKLHAIEANERNWEEQNKMDQVDQDRAEKMMKYDLITKEELDHARFKVTASKYEVERERENQLNAKASLRSLDLELEKARIEAPFDGVVARRYVRAGQKVASGDRLFWVTEVAPLLVKFTLPERFAGKTNKGDVVFVSSASAPEAEHRAKVVQVSPVVDPASDSIDVVAQIEGKPADLRPGMTASVRLESSPAKAQ